MEKQPEIATGQRDTEKATGGNTEKENNYKVES